MTSRTTLDDELCTNDYSVDSHHDPVHLNCTMTNSRCSLARRKRYNLNPSCNLQDHPRLVPLDVQVRQTNEGEGRQAPFVTRRHEKTNRDLLYLEYLYATDRALCWFNLDAMLFCHQYSMWTLFVGVGLVLAQPPKSVRREFFDLFKASKFSIMNPLQKFLYYRIEVIRHPEKVKTARLASKSYILNYPDEFSILNQTTNRRINGVAQENFRWNGQSSNFPIPRQKQWITGWLSSSSFVCVMTYPEEIYLRALTVYDREESSNKNSWKYRTTEHCFFPLVSSLAMILFLSMRLWNNKSCFCNVMLLGIRIESDKHQDWFSTVDRINVEWWKFAMTSKSALKEKRCANDHALGFHHDLVHRNTWKPMEVSYWFMFSSHSMNEGWPCDSSSLVHNSLVCHFKNPEDAK